MTTADQPSIEPPTHVVGVGASTGGLDLLEAFLTALPAATSQAYVVIGSTSGFDDSMQERLAARTKLPLQIAAQGMVLQRGYVYLMPAKHLLRLEDGRLRLSPSPSATVDAQPINTFFRSLARGFGPNAVAVLLSGGGDGVSGACAIHQAGGLVLAQSDLAGTLYETPSSQQAAHVHLVQSPAELAQLITHHVSQHPHLAAVTPHTSLRRDEKHARGVGSARRSSSHSNHSHSADVAVSQTPGVPQASAVAQQPVDQQLLATYDRLLDRFMPASILVNSGFEIVHIFGGAERFLHHRSGRPVKQIFDLIDPSLQTAIRTGLTQVARSGEPARFPDLNFKHGQRSVTLSVTIEPSPEPSGVIDKILILFDAAEPAGVDMEDRAELLKLNDVLQRSNEKLHRINEQLYALNLENQRGGQRLTQVNDEAEGVPRPQRNGVPIERAMDATVTGITIADAATDGWPIVYVNRGFEHLTGYAPESVIGKNCRFLQGPDTDPDTVTQLRAALSQGRPCRVTLLNYKQNGQPFWNDLQLSPLMDEAGKVTHFVGVQHDVTEHVHRERAASESEWEYRSTYENAAVGLAHLDAEGRWVRVNQRLCEILGYNRDELLGMTFHQLTDPEDLQADIGHFQALISGERDSDCHESRYHHRDGHVVWILLTTSRQLRSDGQAAGCIAVIQDITQRKKAEIALEKARRMADSANRAKSSFVTNISHELRSPMTAVLGFADMLADEINVPDQLQKVQTLRRNGQFLLRLLDDILDLSKIESRRFQSDTEPCDLMALIDEVEVLMQGRASQIGSRLWFHFPTPLPKTIYTSSMRVRQILVNLIANAFKFPLRGDVNVTIRYRAEQGEDDQVEPCVEFEVADTGVDISGPAQELAFTPFTPADPEIAQRFAGRGSGLSITKRLVSTLGGMLEFSTGQQGGSTFLARLPVGEAVDMELIGCEARVPEVPTLTEPSQLKSIAGKILVADDRRDIWQVTKYFLERSGAEVEVAEDGRQAVEAVQAAARKGEPFDLLLMDMQMPVMNGLEAVRELRGAGFSLPIIALTADAMKGERQRCLAAGCDDYLTKPIDVVLLTETVAKHLGEKA